MTKRTRHADAEASTRKKSRRIDDHDDDDVAVEEAVDLTKSDTTADAPRAAAAALEVAARTTPATAASAAAAAVGPAGPAAPASPPVAPTDLKHSADAQLVAALPAVVAAPNSTPTVDTKVNPTAAGAPKESDNTDEMERSAKGMLGDLHLTLAQVNAQLKTLSLEESSENEALERARSQRSIKSRQLQAQQREVDGHIHLLMEAVTQRDAVKLRSALLIKPKTTVSAVSPTESKYESKYSSSATAQAPASSSSSGAYRALEYKPTPMPDGPRGPGFSGGFGGFGGSPKKPGAKSPAKVRRAVDNTARYIRYVVDTRGAYEWQDRSASDSSCRGCGAAPSDHWLNDARPDANATADGAGRANAWSWVCPRTRELIEPPVMD